MLDLFGEIPVAWDEVLTWCEIVAPRIGERFLLYYIRCWDVPGKIRVAGNVRVNTTEVTASDRVIPDGTDTVFTPPYPYTLESGSTVKASVMAGAGAPPGGGMPADPTAVEGRPDLNALIAGLTGKGQPNLAASVMRSSPAQG